MRTATLLLCLVLAGCSRGAVPTGADPPAGPSIPSSAPTTRPGPSLLPGPCTPGDGLRISGRSGDGAGGHIFTIWKIASRVPCTLQGRPTLTLLARDGRPLPFTYRHDRWVPQRIVPAPTGPRRFTTVAVETYRCERTRNPRRATTVRITLPGGIRVSGAADIAYCADDPDRSVSTGSIGTWILGSHRPPAHVAYPIGSPQVRGGAATWGRADVDGDGHPDIVVVRRDGAVEARLRDGVVVRALPAGGRLQALSDLDGDGAAEILVGYTAAACCAGTYAFLTSTPTVLTVAHGTLRQVEVPLSFDRGRGDAFAGVTCRAGTVARVRTVLESAPSDHADLRVTRTVWRLDGTRVVRLARTTRAETGDPLKVTASHCPGMGADGWGP